MQWPTTQRLALLPPGAAMPMVQNRCVYTTHTAPPPPPTRTHIHTHHHTTILSSDLVLVFVVIKCAGDVRGLLYGSPVFIWDGEMKKRVAALPTFPTSVAALDFSADGALLAIASSYTWEEGEKELR